mmetsp:Transcript_26826/g.79992  ORF Transcript_26826/g.79992 Transcript_26826/m.79992 type:complete len:427 (-) Transcript_26826:72-1352(-)
MARENFLDDILPDGFVFNCFIVAIAIVASFRTSFALGRFADGAGSIHQMGSQYFQAASSLFAFCRNTQADEADVVQFQETLVRLLSLLNALCLEALEEAALIEADGIPSKTVSTHDYELIDQEPLDQVFQEFIHEQPNTKAETVFESIQFLIMANMKNQVLNVAPPLMGRPFTELSAGFLKYHDGLKMVFEKTPLAYAVITAAILLATTLFVPLMMAKATRGPMGAMSISFGFVFAVWFIYGVADTLDNPYRKSSHVIDAPTAQKEINTALLKLLRMRKNPVPSVDMKVLEKNKRSFRLRSRTLKQTKDAVLGRKGEEDETLEPSDANAWARPAGDEEDAMEEYEGEEEEEEYSEGEESPRPGGELVPLPRGLAAPPPPPGRKKGDDDGLKGKVLTASFEDFDKNMDVGPNPGSPSSQLREIAKQS